jgi:hypothetical protein
LTDFRCLSSICTQASKNSALGAFLFDGYEFTLNDVFNYFLDHPKRKVEKVDGFEVLIISGGIKPERLDLNLIETTNPVYDKSITKYLTESSKSAFIFPFGGNTLVPDEIAYY